MFDLSTFETIASGHTANLKIDTGTVRVWQSRMTIADGECEPIQVEELHNGRWESVCPHGYRLELDGEVIVLDGPPRVFAGGCEAPCYPQGERAHTARRLTSSRY